MTELDGVVAALAAPGQPGATFVALEEATRRAIGHRLFTIMRHDRARDLNTRVYSSRPAEYPAGGAKQVRDSAWTRQLLREGRPFIGRDAEDIRATFADHALILSLGCESVLNLPVLWNGEVIGTINLLDRAGAYAPHHAALGRRFAGLAIPALLAV
ncbi:GAF domain-containing protein [Roseococcus sp. YIM B11640]|uniref:GAF domain-containing protein n=1 Tax=Roseococcus sp. YIM B11640 TaxID=3133973 RepID=UPI003C7D5947